MAGYRGPLRWDRILAWLLLALGIILMIWGALYLSSGANATFLPTAEPFSEVKGGIVNVHLVCQPSSDPYSRILINGTFDHDNDDAIKALDVFYREDKRTVDRSEQYGNSTLWQNRHQLDYIWRGERGKISMMGRLWWQGRWLYSEIRFRYGAPYDGSAPMDALCHNINEEEGKSKILPPGERKAEIPQNVFSLFDKLQLTAKHETLSENPVSPPTSRPAPRIPPLSHDRVGPRHDFTQSSLNAVPAPIMVEHSRIWKWSPNGGWQQVPR